MSYLSALPQLRLFSIFPQLLYLNAQGWQPDHFHDDFDKFHENHDNFHNNYDHFRDGYDHFHDNHDHASGRGDVVKVVHGGEAVAGGEGGGGEERSKVKMSKGRRRRG